jgi:hypothetical protein
VTFARPTADITDSFVYRKFKLPLDHSRLTDPKAIVEPRSAAREAANTTGVSLSEPVRPEHIRNRNVILYDTNELGPCRNSFILREPIPLRRDHSARQVAATPLSMEPVRWPASCAGRSDTRTGAEDTKGVGSPKEPRLRAVMGRSFALLCAVLIGVLNAVPASAFNIQTSTQNICECLCTRRSCMFGAEVIPVSAACPSGTFVTGGGYRWETEPNLSKVQDSFPDAAGGAWTAIAKSPYESPCNERHCRNLTVYAVCAPGER